MTRAYYKYHSSLFKVFFCDKGIILYKNKNGQFRLRAEDIYKGKLKGYREIFFKNEQELEDFKNSFSNYYIDDCRNVIEVLDFLKIDEYDDDYQNAHFE